MLSGLLKRLNLLHQALKYCGIRISSQRKISQAIVVRVRSTKHRIGVTLIHVRSTLYVTGPTVIHTKDIFYPPEARFHPRAPAKNYT